MNTVPKRLPRVVFYHIEKTGGTAITQALKKLYPTVDICPEPYGRYASWLPADLAQFRLFSGHGWYRELKSIPKIDLSLVVLRHPVDRALSYLEYMRYHSQDMVPNDPAIRVAKVMRPDRFFFDAPEALLRRFGNRVVAQLAGTDSWPTRQHLAKAIARLEKFSHVGIYENLSPFLAGLSAALELPEPLTLERVNVTRTSRPHDYPLLMEPLPRAVVDRIAAINDFDIALYEHAVDVYGGWSPLPPQAIELIPYPGLPTTRMENETVVTASDLYSGYMVFGPYARMLPGRYSIDFRLSGDVMPSQLNEVVLELDAYSMSLRKQLAKREIRGDELSGGGMISFPLVVDTELMISDVEFRARKEAVGSVTIRTMVTKN